MQSGVYALAAMTICGGACTLLFDIFRAVRTVKKHGKLMLAVEDFCFCVLSTALVWKCLWNFNGGELRLFEVLGFVIGAILYILLLQKVFFLFFTVIFKNIFKFFDFILQILLTPLRFLYKILLVPLFRRQKAQGIKHNKGKAMKE